MSFNSKYYTEAELELAKIRAANENKGSGRKREISSKYNEYNVLSQKLASTGAILGGLFFSDEKPEDIKERLKELEKENLDTQMKIEELLVKNGYKADYLNDIYSCNKCQDTGVFNNGHCSCFMDIVKRFASATINSTSPMKLSSFDTFDLSLYPDKAIDGGTTKINDIIKHNLNFCKEYAENFHLPLGGILMRGATGLGKTHLSLSVADVVLKKGYSVVYGSAPDLLRRMEKEHFDFNSGDNTLDLLQKTDLLIFDDLGTEFLSQFVNSVLYNIINSRINAGLPTIVNTNLTLSEITDRYGERFSSRLFTFDILAFYGNDIRLMKKFGVKS